MRLRITILKCHSWYLCQMSQLIMLLPILIYNFTCGITKLSWQHSARLQGLQIYEWRCHGIARHLRKPKHTKEQITKDYNRKIRKVLSLKLFCMCVKLKSRYDKQVTKKPPKTRLWALFVTCDIYRLWRPLALRFSWETANRKMSRGHDLAVTFAVCSSRLNRRKGSQR